LVATSTGSMYQLFRGWREWEYNHTVMSHIFLPLVFLFSPLQPFIPATFHRR
jgi:hypothetical protein